MTIVVGWNKLFVTDIVCENIITIEWRYGSL